MTSLSKFSLRSVDISAALLAAAALLSPAAAQVNLDEVVVTPGGRTEPRKRVTGTVQVIGGRDLVAADSPAAGPVAAETPGPAGLVVGPVQVIERSTIERSTAKSVADLLAQNAVGFLSEWTPGQTSINIRGAATDGQGRDFKSQVLVLINGHRAGTANVAKMSLADVDRIEIVRGPSSVIYGSQNMGGVINIMRRDQHHHEDRPHGARHLRRGQRRFMGARAGQGAERWSSQRRRLVRRRLCRKARRFSHQRRGSRGEHRVAAAIRVVLTRLSGQ
jgi:outer membrane cobalamin receptor